MDNVSSWKRFKDKEGDFEVMANEVSSKAVLGSIQIEGPVELLVSGDNEMSLLLPVCSFLQTSILIPTKFSYF